MMKVTVSSCADATDAQELDELEARLEVLNARMKQAEERLGELQLALREEERAASRLHDGCSLLPDEAMGDNLT
jgi:hypothetical protein